MSVTAIIHLRKHGRSANAKYGPFLRPDKAPHEKATDLHLYLGRELSLAEFNEYFAKALESVHLTDRVYGMILERADEVSDVDSTLPLRELHAAELAVIQQGVNEFTAEYNASLVGLQAENDGLRRELQSALVQPDPTKPDEGTISTVKEAPLLVETAPGPAVDGRAPVAVTTTTEPSPSAKASPFAKATEDKTKDGEAGTTLLPEAKSKAKKKK